ncbi:hypothetical protein BLNAU_24092 [Blattamonas nauphoetae]|uniref:Uncharacterized protein n=1 Tax=Blattamonas nauphoetae TaxID=2049346 RepID=A0ABQ9WNV3_9EUKA|nr:hypothetical protein BLNAU_24092 [Blattamonas nauphoetae]
MQRPRVRNESAAKCFTFYLKPLGGNNAGFDSVLLFFKVHKERDGLKIDDLCVMFIQSTLAKEHPISDTGANLMFLWLALLCAVYGLNQQHIHPFFFFLEAAGSQETEQEQGQVTEQKQGQVTDREQGQGTAREQRHIQRITFDPVFVFNLLTPSADSDDIQSEVKGIDLGFPQVKGRIPISRKTLDEFDMLDVVMVGVEKQIEPPYYVKPTPNEQEQATLRFEVSHTRPIPNIFTYFPRRPNGPRPSQLFVETRKDVTFGHEDAKNIVKKEFKNPTSHLLTSVRLIRVWGDKQRIGFGKNKRNKVLSMGVQHPPHRDLHLLWEKKIIPLAQIHLPMNIFPKQTLSLGTRKILTPFEIRGILSLIGKKHRKKRKPMIKHWINEGQPLTQADSEPILSDEGAFSLLVDSNLRSLGTRIPTLRSLNMYELQSLVSFVSGTLTLISDTLRKCECLLESQDESSEDESDESDDDSDKSEDESDESEDDSDKSEDATSTVLTGDGTAITDSMVSHQVEPRQLNEMKKCLKTSLSVASRHLKHVLEHKLLGTRTNVSDADVKIVVEGMKTNPLLPWWCRRHIIPFVTVVPDDCKKLVKRLTKKDKKLKRKDREICITVLLIHAPIEESEKKRLIALINKHFQETDQRTLTSLINQNSLSQKGVNKWNNALTCLEEIETLDSPEKKKALDELPRSVLIDYLQKPRGMRGDKSTILPLIEQAQLPEKDKDTLLSLVDGKPRFTFSRRKEIATLCCPTFPSESEDSLVKTIGVSKLDETNKKDSEKLCDGP